MRLLIQLVTFVSFLLFSFGCGSSAAGSSCKATGFLCESAGSALECQSNLWTSLPCKGPNGCKREGDVVKCDMTGNVEGDACATSAENKGICAKDGTAALECRSGKLVKTMTCRSCAVMGDFVTCTP